MAFGSGVNAKYFKAPPNGAHSECTEVKYLCRAFARMTTASGRKSAMRLFPFVVCNIKYQLMARKNLFSCVTFRPFITFIGGVRSTLREKI